MVCQLFLAILNKEQCYGLSKSVIVFFVAFLTAEHSHYEVYSGETYEAPCTVDIKGDIIQPKQI